MSRKRGQRGGGGAKPFDKYILLSCPEFNDVVDKMIAEDGAKCHGTCPADYSKGVRVHGSSNAGSSVDALTVDKILEKMRELDSAKIADTKRRSSFANFAEDYEGKELKDEEIVKKAATIGPYYNRASNDFESNIFYRGYINWKVYNDKTPDIKMGGKTTNKLKGAKVIFLAYFSFNEEGATPMMNQLLFLNSLNHYGVAEINIVLPYFPVGTLERIVGEGEIPTAYALAHMLNSIPSGAAKNNLYIFDIHALCSRFFFHSNTRPVLISMMEEYMNYINNEKYSGAENFNVIVFPDDGAKKRFEKLLPAGTKKIVCAKVRKGDERIIKIESGLESVMKGADATTVRSVNFFVVDDLVQSGGTVLETLDGIKNDLVEKKAPYLQKIKFIPMITHSVFPKAENISKFFTRDVPATAKVSYANVTKGISASIPAKVTSLITTNSRPLRIKDIEAHLTTLKGDNKPELSVIDISKTLTRVFNNEEGTTITGNKSFHDQ